MPKEVVEEEESNFLWLEMKIWRFNEIYSQMGLIFRLQDLVEMMAQDSSVAWEE